MAESTQVPYQAYKPKRNSRILSAPRVLTAASAATPNDVPQAPALLRPATTIGDVPTVYTTSDRLDVPAPASPPLRTLSRSPASSSVSSLGLPMPMAGFADPPSPERPLSPATTPPTSPRVESPSPAPNGHAPTPTAAPPAAAAIPTSASAAPGVTPPAANGNGKAREVPTTPTISTIDLPARKPSKFRRVPLGGSPVGTPTHAPLASSPLRPSTAASPAVARQFDPVHAQRPSAPASVRTASSTSVLSTLSSGSRLPPSPLSQRGALPPPAPTPPTPQPVSTPSHAGPPPRLDSLPPPAVPTPLRVLSPGQTPSWGPASPIGSTPTSGTRSPAGPARGSAPYRPGFQPRGVYRPRTDEFVAARAAARTAGAVERARLARRLEKLLLLHFPPDAPGTPGSPGGKGVPGTPAPAPPRVARRASSFLDDLAGKSPAELWRGVLAAPLASGGARELREAEQKIAPWEEDAAVARCPFCAERFNQLSNRKHHCRMCGRVVCSLPVRAPARPTLCSALYAPDARTGVLAEVPDAIDYGVRRRASGAGASAALEDDRTSKGVRICKDCRPVVQRQQQSDELRRVPPFARIYEALLELEHEIEEDLPIFHALLADLQAASGAAPPKEASDARRRLLDAFAQYDALAKRLRALPCAPGGAQDRVQAAVQTRAGLFLQKHMFPLQSLPKRENGAATPGESATPEREGAGAGTGKATDMDAEAARALQPLLEQEALLEGFLAEAGARRQLEDARSLRENLAEIRAEIARVMQGADVGAPGGAGRRVNGGARARAGRGSRG